MQRPLAGAVAEALEEESGGEPQPALTPSEQQQPTQEVAAAENSPAGEAAAARTPAALFVPAVSDATAAAANAAATTIANVPVDVQATIEPAAADLEAHIGVGAADVPAPAGPLEMENQMEAGRWRQRMQAAMDAYNENVELMNSGPMAFTHEVLLPLNLDAAQLDEGGLCWCTACPDVLLSVQGTNCPDESQPHCGTMHHC